MGLYDDLPLIQRKQLLFSSHDGTHQELIHIDHSHQIRDVKLCVEHLLRRAEDSTPIQHRLFERHAPQGSVREAREQVVDHHLADCHFETFSSNDSVDDFDDVFVSESTVLEVAPCMSVQLLHLLLCVLVRFEHWFFILIFVL